MSLVIHFSLGESVAIAGTDYAIEWAPPALRMPGQSPMLLTSDPQVLMSGVQVFLAFRQRENSLGIAFDAPRGPIILRKRASQV